MRIRKVISRRRKVSKILDIEIYFICTKEKGKHILENCNELWVFEFLIDHDWTVILDNVNVCCHSDGWSGNFKNKLAGIIVRRVDLFLK